MFLVIVRFSQVAITGTAPVLDAGHSGVANGYPTLVGRQGLINGYLVGPSVDLSGGDFAGVDFGAHWTLSPRQEVPGFDLTGANLTGANLSGVSFVGYPADSLFQLAGQTGTQLANANLSGADVTGAAFGSGTSLAPGSTFQTSYASPSADLTGVTSGGVIGTPASIPPGWAFAFGYFTSPSTTTSGADFSGVDFSGMDLSYFNFSGPKLSGADFTGATLNRVTSGDISGTPAALPANWQINRGYLIGPGADLTGADLSGLDLSGLDLTGANFGACGLAFVVSPGTTPFPAGPGADLSGTNFTGSNLTNASFAGMYTTPDGGVGTGATNLANAKFTNANLTWALFSSVGFMPVQADGTQWGCAGTADFADTVLTGSNITNAVLSIGGIGDPSGVVSGGLTGTTPYLPTGWTAIGGYLVGPGAHLVGADLSGLDLTDMDLTGAVLTGAVLTGADLDGTTLTGATLTGVVSGGITGVPAALPAGWALVGGALVEVQP